MKISPGFVIEISPGLFSCLFKHLAKKGCLLWQPYSQIIFYRLLHQYFGYNRLFAGMPMNKVNSAS